MRKKLSVISAFLIFSMTFSACSLSSQYSEDDYDVIASYIAHAVIKNDKNMAYKLVDVELPEETKEDENVISKTGEKTGEEDTSTRDENKGAKEESKESPDNESSDDNQMTPLGKILGAPDSFTIEYAGYEVKDDLNSSDYFSLSPDEGKKLGVVTFKITNTSDEGKSISLLPDGIKYILNCDGEDIRTLTTVLDNDIHYYEGKFEAHKSKNVILVFQITEGAKHVELNITSGAGTYSHTIQ